MRRLLRWLARDESAPVAAPEPEPLVDAPKLIHRIDLRVDVSCPCGSQVIHSLTLMSTAECPRCGRLLAIRGIQYERSSPAAVPKPVISVGWVQSDETLRRLSRARGVH
jgi:hypothetical protein